MIEFQPNTSSFYLENKAFCDTLIEKCERLHADYSGYCDSYGFNVRIQLSYQGVYATYIFEKGQHSSGITPLSSGRNVIYTSVDILLPHCRSKYVLRSSNLLRILCSEKVKKILPAPYYLNAAFKPTSLWLKELACFLSDNQVIRIYLKKGKLSVRMHQANSENFPFSNHVINTLSQV